MKSERVTQAWEFYRDNCQGYKETMRQEFRRLDEYVSNIESENAKLREYVQMLAKATVYDPCEWCQYDGDGTCGTETEPMREGCRLRSELRELGVEVDE